MIRTIRRPTSLLFALIAALVLAGCASGPSRAGSAAIVGDHTIPLDDVQQEIRWLLDNVPQAEQAHQQRKLDQHARAVVRGRVLHQLVTVAAEREGLHADEAELDQLIEASGGTDAVARQLGIAPARVRDAAADQILLQQLGRSYADRLSVHLAGAVIVEESAGSTAKDQARALGERISADPARVAEIVRDSGHQLIDQEMSFAEALMADPELGSSALFGAPEGSVLVIQPSQGQVGWLVALVQDRTVGPGSGSQAGVESQLDPQTLYLAGLRQLQPIADELGVQLNPRYGVWDSTAMVAVASEQELTGYQFTRLRTVAS